MSSSFKSGNVTFVVSGNRAAEFTGYLSQLNKTAAFSDQIAFISGQGFSTVVITTDPNDLPRSIRSSLYNQVYQTKMNIFDDKGKPIIGEDGKPQTKTIESVRSNFRCDR